MEEGLKDLGKQIRKFAKKEEAPVKEVPDDVFLCERCNKMKFLRGSQLLTFKSVSPSKVGSDFNLKTLHLCRSCATHVYLKIVDWANPWEDHGN